MTCIGNRLRIHERVGMKNLFKHGAVAASTAGLLLLAACGGSGGGPGGTSQSGNQGFKGSHQGTAGGGIDMSRTQPAAPIKGAKTGGTVYVDREGGTETFDPTESYYVDTTSILSGMVVRSLTQYVYKNGQMVLIPDLATKWTSNKNFTSWTFTIRKGIKFENGQPVTMADWKYGIERSFDRSTFPLGANYSNQYFLQGSTYKGPYKSGQNYKGIVINGQNLTIKMARPFPDMPYWASFPAMSPIPPGSASDPAKYKLDPWATGPYQFAQYTPSQSLTLVRNKYWSQKTDSGRHAYPDKFVFNFNQPGTKTDQIIKQDSGQGAQTLTYDNVLSSDYLYFSQQAPNQLTTGSSPCTYIWYPDNRKITNIKVRQALAWAYPYKAAWAAGGEIPGVTRVPASNIMTPGIPGSTNTNPLPGHKPGSTDPAKAKALLKQANALGYTINFPYQKDVQTSVAVMQQVSKALKKAGFNPQPYATTSANYYTVIADPKAPINVRSVGWCSDWPKGSSWIPPEFQSTKITSEGLGNNYEAFSNKAVDKRILQIGTLPQSKQAAAWNALQNEIMTKYFPIFPTAYGGDAMIHGTKINNMYNDSVLAMPYWKDMWVG